MRLMLLCGAARAAAATQGGDGHEWLRHMEPSVLDHELAALGKFVLGKTAQSGIKISMMGTWPDAPVAADNCFSLAEEAFDRAEAGVSWDDGPNPIKSRWR